MDSTLTCYSFSSFIVCVSVLVLNVTINDISVMHVIANWCAGRLKKKLDLLLGPHAIEIS